jgi:hypothetical protein
VKFPRSDLFVSSKFAALNFCLLTLYTWGGTVLLLFSCCNSVLTDIPSLYNASATYDAQRDAYNKDGTGMCSMSTLAMLRIGI